MDWVEAIGYCGTTLTVAAYAMKALVHLRVAAVLSSVAFLAYGGMTGSAPVMLMEIILLPLNLFRLLELCTLPAKLAALLRQARRTA